MILTLPKIALSCGVTLGLGSGLLGGMSFTMLSTPSPAIVKGEVLQMNGDPTLYLVTGVSGLTISVAQPLAALYVSVNVCEVAPTSPDSMFLGEANGSPK